jgi:nucleoside-diphosphate-sugar epimerase
LLPSLLRAAETGTPVRLTHGTQARDFTYVGDEAEGLVRLGLHASTKETVVNLATGRLTRVRAFAEIAARVLGVDSELLLFGALPTRAGEMEHGPVTIERLWRLCGWVPLTAVPEGIRRTADLVVRHPGTWDGHVPTISMPVRAMASVGVTS